MSLFVRKNQMPPLGVLRSRSSLISQPQSSSAALSRGLVLCRSCGRDTIFDLHLGHLDHRVDHLSLVANLDTVLFVGL